VRFWHGVVDSERGRIVGSDMRGTIQKRSSVGLPIVSGFLRVLGISLVVAIVARGRRRCGAAVGLRHA
jgi:hypothetical protein